jgi:multiple sugar transport system substrate-binding protein
METERCVDAQAEIQTQGGRTVLKVLKIVVCVTLFGFMVFGAAMGQTIHLLMEGVPDTFIIQKLLPEFKQQSGIDVDFEVVNYAQMHAKLLPQLMARQGAYDAIVVDNYWAGEFPAGGWLEPLDNLVKKTPSIKLNEYVPSMLDMVGYYQGTLYMIPFYNYTMLLFYREDLLQDAGLKRAYKAQYGKDLKIPDNLKDYVELCSFMTKNQGGQGIYGASMMGLKPDPICMEWSNYLFSLGGDYYNRKTWKPTINDPAGVEATRLYVTNMTKNAPPGAPGYGFDEAIQLFMQGKAFSIVTFWMFYIDMQDPSKSQVAGKVGQSVMPGGSNLNGGWGWAIPKSSPNKEAAWKFISWVESFPIAKKRALAGGAPTRRDVFLDPEVDAKYPWYPKVMEILKTAKPVPEFAYSTQMIEVVGRELSLSVEGKDINKALDTAADELDRLAKRARLQK